MLIVDNFFSSKINCIISAYETVPWNFLKILPRLELMPIQYRFVDPYVVSWKKS